MINNTNKNVSVWRGDKTPPTEYHVWIKSNGSVLINKDGTWFTQISESTNDSVNVCNLSNIRRIPSVLAAAQVVKQYLGSEVFHVGYKLRYNEAPAGYDPVWKEYILTGNTWQRLDNWKLVFTTDLMNNEEIIKSGHLPSYVDDVLEYSSVTKFPIYGESGKIYLDTSTNKSYRWSGTQYVLIALTDIVTSESDGLMSSEMYNKLEKTASDLDIHDRQNQVAFAEISTILDKKVGKIVDSKGNIISEGTSVVTIPDGTSDTRGLLTPDIYKQIEDNKKMSEYLDENKVEEIRNLQGTLFPKVGSIVTIPNATSQSAGLMTSNDKIKLDSIESEFVKDLGLVASADEGDQIAAKSEIAGNVKISFIRYRTAGVRAERVTTIFQWRNGVNETAQIKFVDKAQWRRNVTGATGVAGAPTNAFNWERTGAHYLGYDAANRKIQLMDYNQTVIKTVQLPLAQEGGTDGLLSGKDKMAIGSIITEASFNQSIGKATFYNDDHEEVTSFEIGTATEDHDGLMSQYLVNSVHDGETHIANQNNPHNVTKSQVGLGNVTNDAQVKRSEMGVPNGVALLNSEGKISSSYLPSYVSAVITADSYSTLPSIGEEDKIYVTKDTNLTYRWSGTAYVEISPSIALGETSTTAYAGDKGKALSNSVTDLRYRVGGGWVVTDNMDFAIIGTGDTRVEIAPGARILASVVGQGTSFTISSNTDTASIGYGANIGKGSKLGQNISAAVEQVRDSNGTLKSALVLKEAGSDTCLKVLCRDNGELKLGTYTNLTNTGNWVDLARMEKISTMIDVESNQGVVFYPNRLSNNSSDTEIIVGTNTTIGSNVTIGSYSGIGEGIKIAKHSESSAWIIGTAYSLGETNDYTAYIGEGAQISNYVKVSTSIEDDGTGYVLLGDGTTKIKKGVTIDGNSGSSEQLVHEHQGSWLIGEDLTPTATTATLGKGVILVGTTATNRPMLIKAGGATALIGANFNAYSGVTLGSYSSLGNQAKLGDNVEIIQGASGLTIVSNDYGMTVGTKVSIGNNVSLGNNVIISNDVSISTSVSVSDMGDEVSVGDVTISTGIRITKNASATTIQNGNGSATAGGKLQFGTGNIIWSGVEIGTGVKITENLTADSTSYKLGENNQVTISKGLNIYCSDTEHKLQIIAPTTDGGAIYSYGKVTLGTNFTAAENTSLKVSLGTGSIDTTQYYRLTDPRGIMQEANIGSGVTIDSGIQIRESGSGGIQIKVPSTGQWITIN